jgi:hypothetical protein
MVNKFKINSAWCLSAAAMCAALAGCGGGGGSGGASGPSGTASGALNLSISNGPFEAKTGSSIQITANASTDQSNIQSLSWSAVASDPSAPPLILGNGACESGTKNNVTYPASSLRATGYSNWTCALSVAASNKLTKTTTYDVTVLVTDDRKNVNTASTKVVYLVVPPSAVGSGNGVPGADGLLANAGGDFTIQSGATAPLSCQASSGLGPYSYQWSIVGNGGFPLSLSSYATAQSSFVTPSSTSSTTLTMQCVVTDANSVTSTSQVKVSVVPTALSKPLVAFAGSNYVIQPSATAPLSCQATGGLAPYTYLWTVVNNANLPISLSAYSAAQTNFVAPSVASATALTLQCAATDAANNTSVSQITVTDSPTPIKALVANAGLGFSVTPGATGNLHCSAIGGVTGLTGYAYQWSVTANGGLNLPLNSYVTQDASFTAPSVAVATDFSFQCAVSDSAGNTSTSAVTVTDTAAVASSSSLVASAGKGLNVNPGQTAALDASATGWFSSAGAATTGPTISYKWSTSYPGVVINNSNAATTSFVAPTTITTATPIQFTLTASSGANSSVANVTFLVDPYAPFTVAVSPPAQIVKANTGVATLQANASTSNASPTLYYSWTYVSGPASPTLGGQQTATMGFVPTAVGTYLFQVAVGYQPITATYPGVYFANATVTAN